MLDQKTEPPSDLEPSAREAAHQPDDETPPWEDQDAASSGGGALGRFRAGVADPNAGGRRPAPIWRRLLVLLIQATLLIGVAFSVLSVLAVFIFGWTGTPPTITMTQRAMAGMDVQREWTPLKDVSPHLVRAVIAAEDQRFCTHNGFDVVEIRRAIEAAERGRNLRGASTITQQTAKNVYLFNGGGFVRKGIEAWFTVLTEFMWSKPRIMETYLNVAEWGDGLFGAEAAAQARFGVSAKDLTPTQAALLAAVLPSPHRWRIDGSYAQSRAGQIRTLMGVVRRDGLDACVVS